MEPVPPIILDDNGDVELFGSVREAETYVEPIDVENEEYRFYDATGLVLEGEVQTMPATGGRVRRLFNPPVRHVRIVVALDAERRADELAHVLRSYLARVGADRTGIHDEHLRDMALDQLVTAARDVLQPGSPEFMSSVASRPEREPREHVRRVVRGFYYFFFWMFAGREVVSPWLADRPFMASLWLTFWTGIPGMVILLFIYGAVVLWFFVPLLVGVTIWAYVGALREDRANAARAQASKDSSE